MLAGAGFDGSAGDLPVGQPRGRVGAEGGGCGGITTSCLGRSRGGSRPRTVPASSRRANVCRAYRAHAVGPVYFTCQRPDAMRVMLAKLRLRLAMVAPAAVWSVQDVSKTNGSLNVAKRGHIRGTVTVWVVAGQTAYPRLTCENITFTQFSRRFQDN